MHHFWMLGSMSQILLVRYLVENREALLLPMGGFGNRVADFHNKKRTRYRLLMSIRLGLSMWSGSCKALLISRDNEGSGQFMAKHDSASAEPVNPAYSPRLTNQDLAPVHQQHWNWYNLFSFWMSDVHSMGGYVVAASFFALGLAGWQVLVSLLVGIVIVQMFANLVARPSQVSGVPYAVISRQAFGVFGANIPAILRGLMAMAWYGIQTWLVSNALLLVLLKFFPRLMPWTVPHFIGLSALGWGCFLVMWLLQALIFWQGMDAIKRFIDVAGPAVYIVMLVLAIWITSQTGFSGISLTLSQKSLAPSEQVWQMISASALVVSYFSGPLLNFGDFARYASDMHQVRQGNRWGLPFNFLLFSIITVVIVSGTHSLFGQMITDPIETVTRVGSGLAVAVALLTMIIATIGINIVANFVSPAFDFSNCAPNKISFRSGGMLAALGSVLLTPWNLFHSPELIHYTLDVLGAFMGPLFGILLCDFYLINRATVRVDDLFSVSPQGAYWYRKGINPRAVMALVPSVLLCLMITYFSYLQALADFSWFLGVMLSATIYLTLARHRRLPARVHPQTAVYRSEL